MSINKFILIIGLALVSISAIADEGASESAHNWRGFYVGGFMGGTFSTKSDAGLCIGGYPRKSCNPHELTEFDGHYYAHELSDAAQSSQSVISGAQIGYNWQVEHPQGYKWLPNVWGVEAEYGHLNYKESIGGLNTGGAVPEPGLPGSADYTTSLKNYGFIGGKVGYAIDRVLVYIKGGAVISDMETKFCTNPDQICLNGNPSENAKSTGAGYALGGGVEYALPWGDNDKWSIKAEYLMMDLPSLATANIGTKNGVPPTSYPLGFAIYQEMNNFKTGKIAINYHF